MPSKDRRVPFEIEAIGDEFVDAQLGDARRTKRLKRIVERLADEPSRSFPEALVSVGELEAGYRFFGNENVKPEDILAPHRERAWARGRECTQLYVHHDTTENRFGGNSRREGLGTLMNGGHGFYMHAALLTSLDAGMERATPLGEVGHELVVRQEGPAKRRKPWREAYADPNKESLRWVRGMQRADEDAKTHDLSVVHVADREASHYELLAQCWAWGGRFIVRVRGGFLDRAEVLEHIEGVLERRVDISPRTSPGGRRRPKETRERRMATLDFSASMLRLQRPAHVATTVVPEVVLGVIKVTEREAPAGCEPLSWTLITTEPISDSSSVETIVDAYRSRWLIEEFWKALKTGCDFEARQLESLHSLHNALAICIPIAWHMLLLRNVGRDAPETPGARLVSPLQLGLLLAIAGGPLNQWGIRLSTDANAGELLHAVARLGGHLPRNGPPGWITIRRGLDELYKLEASAIRFGFESCDQ